ncbi:hypothetical protein [Opitutus sp. GAS368]|jgi:outer membrane protein TolC|uniref:hypothetical protein n=1 Tax=Opitutus sp. GAS368 TaxID=1882749 RepID=UPI000B8451BE|nr:hypothetical protein [Opitutus sp. GAS368]
MLGGYFIPRGCAATGLEVATAESTMSNLEFSTVQLRGQQLVTAIALVRSPGGGWPEAKQL